jgi:ubiquitin C-terminal hydrolase
MTDCASTIVIPAAHLTPGHTQSFAISSGKLFGTVTFTFEGDYTEIRVAFPHSANPNGHVLSVTLLSDSSSIDQTLTIPCTHPTVVQRLSLGTRDLVRWLNDNELRMSVLLASALRRGPKKRPPTHIPDSSDLLPGTFLWTISEDSIRKILDAVKAEKDITLTSPEFTIEGHTFHLELCAGFTECVVSLPCEGVGRFGARSSVTVLGVGGARSDRTVTVSTIAGTMRKFTLPVEFWSDSVNEWLDDRGQLRIQFSVPTGGGEVVTTSVTRESISAPGYLGLTNQGATCYMNAMLQSLFHLRAFRALVYEMPTTGSEDLATSIPLNLQRLFCRMQLGTKSCSTRPLTRSFGWDDSQGIIQHDTHEFCRVLLDNLETKMRNTRLEGRVAELFRGKFRSCIRCINVAFESGLEEEFYDLSLQVKGCNNLEEAFDRYTEQQRLDGANQYDAGEHGMQDALMSVEFLEFPPILQLHLRRFEYDADFDENVKINDRFEFPTEIDLDRFLAVRADRSHSTRYDLCGVLVHSGDVSFGHYYAFLRTSTDPQWFEFNDTHVTLATEEEAVQANFGGSYEKSKSSRTQSWWDDSASAYVLVYVRHDAAETVFQRIPDDAIPQHVSACMDQPDSEGKSMSSYYWKGKTTADVYDIEACGIANCAAGKVGFKCEKLVKRFEVPENETRLGMYQKMAALFGLSVDEIRVWHSSHFFPTVFYGKADMSPLFWPTFYSYFVERKPAQELLVLAPDLRTIYLKFFNPEWELPLQYLGICRKSCSMKAALLFVEVCNRLGIPDNTPLEMYHELQQETVHKLTLMSSSTLASLDINNGTVLVFTLAPVVVVPPTFTFVPRPPSSDTDSPPEETAATPPAETDNLPVFDVAGVTTSVVSLEGFYDRQKKSSSEFLLFSRSELCTPVCTIRYRSSTDPAKLISFIQKVVEENVRRSPIDPLTSTFLVFQPHYYEDGPAQTPIDTHHSYSTSSLFGTSAGLKPRLYFDILEGIPTKDYENGWFVTLEIRICGTIRATHVALPTQSTFGELVEQLRTQRFLGPAVPIRGTICDDWSVTVLTEATRLFHHPRLKIEVVPVEQRNLPPEAKLLCTVVGDVDTSNYFRPVGWPAFIPVM